MEELSQIVLQNRSVLQPSPSIVSGGDCGACVLAGLLNISVKKAYELHGTDDNINKESSFTIHSMRKTLEILSYHTNTSIHKLSHVVTEIPIWPQDYMLFTNSSFGFLGTTMFRPWTEYLRAMLCGGYYGITQVKNNGYSKIIGNNIIDYPSTDHWIMICGWRLLSTKIDNLGHKLEDQLLISNSHGILEQWIDTQEFLKLWGGFACMYAKL